MGFGDGSDISWTIRKQSRSRQITTPTPHHSIFTGPMLFLTPNQQCQITEGTGNYHLKFIPHISNYVNMTHTHQFNGALSRTTWVGRYQKGNTNLDFTEATATKWQWHQLGHMQVCTSLQTDNHASTPPISFLQAGCPSCRRTNSVKALKAMNM